MPTKTTTKKKATKKKAAPKKTTTRTTKKTTKKSSGKKVSEKMLVIAPSHEAFWVTDGQTLDSLVALHDALSAMEKEVFGHHVNSEKNDFANWVETALCDEDCAADLRKAKTARGAQTVVVRHLKYYKL